MASGEGTLLSLIRMTIDKGGEVLAYHPVFLYQFVWGLIGYVVAHFVSNRARFKGQVTLFYFTWLGFGSALLAGLNAPENGGVNGAQLFWLIIGVLALAAYLAVVLTVAFSNIQESTQMLIILPSTVFLVLMCMALVRIEQVAGYYKCGKCGHRAVPTYMQTTMAPHIGRTRYMRCPECGKLSWQKKVISKE
jgi:DNA-directed RNA polymerase subunit RPC12/RpoP